MKYDEAARFGGYVPTAEAAAEVFLPDGRIGCVSCHVPYARAHGQPPQTRSGLCFACHALCSVENENGVPASASGGGVAGGGVGVSGTAVGAAVFMSGSDPPWKDSKSKMFRLMSGPRSALTTKKMPATVAATPRSPKHTTTVSGSPATRDLVR